MRYLVVYDITDDSDRTGVSEILKNYGLKRFQKSAFIGKLKHSKYNSLITDLTNRQGVLKIMVAPICDKDFENIKFFGFDIIEENEHAIKFF